MVTLVSRVGYRKLLILHAGVVSSYCNSMRLRLVRFPSLSLTSQICKENRLKWHRKRQAELNVITGDWRPPSADAFVLADAGVHRVTWFMSA